MYWRAGSGSSCGVGLRLGPVRAEYCTDGNQANGRGLHSSTFQLNLSQI